MHRFFAVTAQMLHLSEFTQEIFYDLYVNSYGASGTLGTIVPAVVIPTDINVMIVDKSMLLEHLTRQMTSIGNDIVDMVNKNNHHDAAQLLGTLNTVSQDLQRLLACPARSIMFDDGRVFGK
jgi:hypothetical protein